MQFKLKSPFQPTGDQPQAIAKLTDSVIQGNPHQTLLGVTGSGKTFTLANVIQNVQLPTLVISHNKTLGAQLYQEFRDFFPHNAVSYFVSYYDYYQPEAYLPATDTYIEKETQINDEIDKLRLSATANLLTRPDVIVIASVSCIYNLGSPTEYNRNFIELKLDQAISQKELIRKLIAIQYGRSDYEIKRGFFRVSGDILTLWPADLDHAYKIEFLNDRLEGITPIDPILGSKISSSSIDPAKPYLIFPAKHYQTKGEDQAAIFKAIKLDLALQLRHLKASGHLVEAYRLNQRVRHDLEMITELGYVNGIENYSRYFDGRNPGDPPYTLLDYFKYNASLFPHKHLKKSSFLTIIDESHITLPQLRGMYRGDQSRKQTLIDFGFRLPSALDNRPLTFTEIQTRLPQVVYASATPETLELNLSGPNLAQQLLRPNGLLDPDIEVRPTTGQIPNLIQEINKRFLKKERVLVTTLTKKTAEALTEYLNDPQKYLAALARKVNPTTSLPKVQYLHAEVTTLDRQDILDSLRAGEFDVVVGINLLREGLDLPEVSLVAILEADKSGFLRSKTSLLQIMGRAARHQNGHVLMYADQATPAMTEAIAEVNKRRLTQIHYNQAHHLTPQSVQKPIRAKLLVREPIETKANPFPDAIDPDSLTPHDKVLLIKKTRQLMNQAAKAWQFEKAARYRDILAKLEPKSTIIT